MIDHLEKAGRQRHSAMKVFLTTTVAASMLLGASHHAFASITNTATVTATPPSGPDISESSSEEIFLEGGTPSFSVTKSLTSLTVALGDDNDQPDGGDILTYQIAVANTGNQSLDNVLVSDPGPTFGSGNAPATNPTINPPTFDSGDDGDGILEPGETWIYTYTYSLTQTDVDNGAGDNAYNTASVQADDPGGTTITTPDPGSVLSVTEPIPSAPSVTFSKLASRDGTTEDDGSTTAYALGETVTYLFSVVNTGNVTLSGVSVSDDAFSGTGTLSSITPATATLAPGQSQVFTATYVITQADIDAE